MIPIFTGYIDGESLGVYIPFLRLVNPSSLGDYLKNLNGQDIELIIRKPKTSLRSINAGLRMENLSNDELIELIKSGDPKESWDAEYELKTRLDYYGETLEQIVVLANKMLEGK